MLSPRQLSSASHEALGGSVGGPPPSLRFTKESMARLRAHLGDGKGECECVVVLLVFLYVVCRCE